MQTTHVASSGRSYAAGYRKLTGPMRLGEMAAELFDQMPRRPHRLAIIDAVKRAAPALGLSDSAVRVADYLWSLSWDRDWLPDSRPIVWPRNEDIADATARCVRQVQRALRELIEARLIAMTDEGSRHRRGRREDGKIVHAVGINLAPAALRQAELAQLAGEIEQERRARLALRRRASAARRRIRQILDAAEAAGLALHDDRAYALTVLCEPKGELVGDVAALEAVCVHLQGVYDQAVQTADEPVKAVNMSSTDDSNVTRTITTKPIAPQSNCNPQGSERSKSADPANLPPSLRLVLSACPSLARLTQADRCSWPDLTDLAEGATRSLGINRDAWVDACHTMGRERAATCVAIIIEKSQLAARLAEAGEEPIRSPGGYLRAMTRRAAAGTLALDRSLFKLAKLH
jgi:replication initiation protein RepC